MQHFLIGGAAVAALFLVACADAAGGAADEAVVPAERKVERLPLPLGFYVAAEVTCAGASNATLSLLRAGGVNTSRTPCDFDSIVQTGDNRFRVTETCTQGGAAWGQEEERATSVATYEITGPASYAVIPEGSTDAFAYTHCPQDSLPEPWRDNDISDLIAG